MNRLYTELYGDVLIATFNGCIDRKSTPQLEVELVESIEPATHIACDLTDVAYISSSGYRLLLKLYHHAATNRGQVALVGVSGETRDTMSATGLDQFFTIVESLDEALEALCREAAGHGGLRWTNR